MPANPLKTLDSEEIASSARRGQMFLIRFRHEQLAHAAPEKRCAHRPRALVLNVPDSLGHGHAHFANAIAGLTACYGTIEEPQGA